MNIEPTETAWPIPVPLMVMGGVGLWVMSQFMNSRALLGLVVLGLYYGYERSRIHRNFREWLYGLSDHTEDTNKVIFKENGLKKIRGIDIVTNMDPEITILLKRLKTYRRYNKVSYDNGYKFMLRFMVGVREIESGIERPRQIYENTELYLKTALNHFQGIVTAIPERSLNQHLHRSASISTPPLNLEAVGHLCRALEVYGNRRLYNLSLSLSQDWAQRPDIYKHEIVGTDIQPANAHHLHEYH